MADLEIRIPTNKVKLVVGPGGTKIGEIQKKSKARVQVKKEESELSKGFGAGLKPGLKAEAPKAAGVCVWRGGGGVKRELDSEKKTGGREGGR